MSAIFIERWTVAEKKRIWHRFWFINVLQTKSSGFWDILTQCIKFLRNNGEWPHNFRSHSFGVVFHTAWHIIWRITPGFARCYLFNHIHFSSSCLPPVVSIRNGRFLFSMIFTSVVSARLSLSINRLIGSVINHFILSSNQKRRAQQRTSQNGKIGVEANVGDTKSSTKRYRIQWNRLLLLFFSLLTNVFCIQLTFPLEIQFVLLFVHFPERVCAFTYRYVYLTHVQIVHM